MEENLGNYRLVIIGLVRRLPGSCECARSDSNGVGATLILGLIGSLVGGFLGNPLVEGQWDSMAPGSRLDHRERSSHLIFYRAMGRGRTV